MKAAAFEYTRPGSLQEALRRCARTKAAPSSWLADNRWDPC